MFIFSNSCPSYPWKHFLLRFLHLLVIFLFCFAVFFLFFFLYNVFMQITCWLFLLLFTIEKHKFLLQELYADDSCQRETSRIFLYVMQSFVYKYAYALFLPGQGEQAWNWFSVKKKKSLCCCNSSILLPASMAYLHKSLISLTSVTEKDSENSLLLVIHSVTNHHCKQEFRGCTPACASHL